MMELVLANNRRLLKGGCEAAKNDSAKFWNYFEYLKKNYIFF